ncbi:hypothetical protein WA026_001796 [Henosepilachna vigintioctopunctata]|uniref:Nucleoporin NUP42 n=1 Tax=Henosepilachna vigintioctopunctata TaxID=420089 RepID=A0AAW1UKN6_9CUCU
MVVCKFFLQGECKFGENCRFDHQFPNGNISGVLQNQQPFHSNQNQVFVTKPANEVDTNTLITSVHNDMVSVEKSGQWLLTCYAPFKEKALFPGFEDQSFEEIRLAFYEAQKTNSSDQYKQQLQQALIDAKLKFKALQNPTKEIVEILRNIYNAQLISPSNSSSNQNLVFGSKISGQSSNNVFGQNTPPQVGSPNSSTLFGQNVGNNSTSQVFGQTNVNQNTTGIFGQPSKGSLFGNNNGMFTQNTNQQNSTSIFATANQNLFGAINPSQSTKNIFSNSPQQLNSFQQTNQSLFTSVGQTQQNPSQNIFANIQNHQVGTSNMLTSQSVPLQGSLFSQVSAEMNQSPQNKPNDTQGLVKSQIFNQQPNSIFTNNTQISSVPFNNNSTSIFNNAQAQSSSIFNSLGQQEPSKSIFGNSNQNTTGNNPVSLNIFGSGNNAINIIKDAYSKLEELSEDDIKWFKSNDLDIAAIPEKPPTYEMCFN